MGALNSRGLIEQFERRGMLLAPDALDYIDQHEQGEKLVKRILGGNNAGNFIIRADDIKALESSEQIEALKSSEQINPEDIADASPTAATAVMAGSFDENSVSDVVTQEAGIPPTTSAPMMPSVPSTPATPVTPVLSENRGGGVGHSIKPLLRASSIETDIRILKDVSGKSVCQGKIEDFRHYFNDRYRAIRKILRRRRELGGAQEISRAKRRAGEVKIIGIVSEKRATSKGSVLLTIEDDTDSITAWIGKENPLIGEPILLDEVIGMVGKVSAKGLFAVESIVRPDIPVMRERNYSKERAFCAMLSDIHIGSNTFLEERFDNFLEWLSGPDETARMIKYIVVPGDLVDGIGVYPNQEKELVIMDVYDQYAALDAKFAKIPDDKNIIVIPGNHDAVRPAEPQPAFPENIRKLLPSSNITWMGNPSSFSLSGVNFLAYHGKSFDDVIAAIPYTSYSKPIDVMKELLKRRHMAPIYGDKTPLAPEWQDYMVIDEIPDVFVTGHVHQTGIENYRGITLVNASCWQSQTDFQKKMNQMPDPCKVPIVDLKSGRFTIKEF